MRCCEALRGVARRCEVYLRYLPTEFIIRALFELIQGTVHVSTDIIWTGLGCL